jgi:hypothetical protein
MSDVVDMLRFKQSRQGTVPASRPASSFEDCLFIDTITDMMTVVERLEEASSIEQLQLTDYERGQLDFLVLLSEQLGELWDKLGFNEVEEENDCE